MYHRGKEKLLFTIISKSIYKNYDKMLNNRKKCVKMSSKTLRKAHGYTLRLITMLIQDYLQKIQLIKLVYENHINRVID